MSRRGIYGSVTRLGKVVQLLSISVSKLRRLRIVLRHDHGGDLFLDVLVGVYPVKEFAHKGLGRRPRIPHGTAAHSPVGEDKV